MMNTDFQQLPAGGIRRYAAKWILAAYSVLAGLGVGLHLVTGIVAGQPPNVVYVGLTIAIAVAGIVTLQYVDRNLRLSMVGFAWVSWICFTGLMFYDLQRDRDILPMILLLFASIFALGLVMGFQPAFYHALRIVVALLALGLIFQMDWAMIPYSIIAIVFSLPAIVVEKLIAESTQELLQINEQLRQEVVKRQRAQAELQRHQAHLEELVAERTAELTQANAELQTRNQELDAYGHTVAHDLKNPLSTLIGFSELLFSRYDQMETDKRQFALTAIVQSGRKMVNIIDELLLFASVRKADAVTSTAIDMDAVIKDAFQRLIGLTEEYHPDIVVPSQWPTVWGHAPWIEEVWGNYLSNAIKYGGRPTEKIPPHLELGYNLLEFGLPNLSKMSEQAPRANLETKNSKSKIRFWVRDNGKGMTFEEQARLFTPFTRLSEVRAKGHGLGLSIVKRIVEKCGGEVGVESVVGQGSTFYFTLPAETPQN